MPNCKNCGSPSVVKSGKAGGKQRYRCSECGMHFTEGDKRTNIATAAKKAACVLLYALSKASFRMLASIADTSPSLVYRWISEAGAEFPNGEASVLKELMPEEASKALFGQDGEFDQSLPVFVASGSISEGAKIVITLQRRAKE